MKRFCLTSPCVSLTGLEDPSVAVRFCPLLFKPLQDPSAVGDKQMMIDGDYRFIKKNSTKRKFPTESFLDIRSNSE